MIYDPTNKDDIQKRNFRGRDPLRAWMLRITAGAICALSTFSLAIASGAAEKGVIFAGAAYTADAANANRLLPHASNLLTEHDLIELNAQLQAAITAARPQHLQVEFGTLGALDGSTTSTAFAVALDRELVLIEQIGANHKLLYELAIQLIFFDFREAQLLAAYPLTLQFIDTLPRAPTPEEISRSVHHVLFGEGTASLVPSVTQTLSALSLPGPAARRLQVSSVQALASAREAQPKIADRAEQGIIGHEFSKLLSSQLGIALLPHRQGHAVGGVMATRFADGRVFNLAVPEPDYEIHLSLRDFRGRTITAHRAYTQELFGAFFELRVIEPLLDKVYFEREDLRYGATKTMPTTQAGFDPTPAYYETLLRGLDNLAAAIAGQAQDWISQQPESRRLSAQLLALSELVDQCR